MWPDLASFDLENNKLRDLKRFSLPELDTQRQSQPLPVVPDKAFNFNYNVIITSWLMRIKHDDVIMASLIYKNVKAPKASTNINNSIELDQDDWSSVPFERLMWPVTRRRHWAISDIDE